MPPLGLPATAVGAFLALTCLFVGVALWRQWAKHDDQLSLETDAVLIRPLVELLVPGATFSRPKIILSGWHPCLLMAEEEGASGVTPSQIDGSLLGQNLVIVELEDPSSWIVRLDLAFGVAGHLRIRSMARLAPGGFWTKGFENHSAGSRRLGAGHSIDWAPLGDRTGKVVETPLNAVPIERVLSDALFDHLRAHPDLMVAMAGNTLWVVVPRTIRAFQRRVAGPTDLIAC